MTRHTLDSTLCVLLAVLMLPVLACSASAYTDGSQPPRSIPVRLFVGYPDEQELQIVARAAMGSSDVGTPSFLTGDHYWTKRLADGATESRLDLWASAPEGFDERSQLLVFCRFIDPEVKLDPNLQLPAELTGLQVRATVRAIRYEWHETEYQISAPGGLIPGIQRAYLLDGRTNTWSARTFFVNVDRSPSDGFPL
jgi:hypothetical protein